MSREATDLGPARLARRYRRLLLAYPRAYRRRHGDEILTTLLDTASAGQDRPTASDTLHLLASGVRQRFRLPVGRMMVVAAVLSAVTLGGVGAAAGSWLGALFPADQPADAEARWLAALATGQPYGDRVSSDGSPVEHSLVHATAPVSIDEWSVADARDRLAAAGWRLDPVVEKPAMMWRGGPPPDDQPMPLVGNTEWIMGQRDGVMLRAFVSTVEGQSRIHVSARPAVPGTLVPLTVVGWLIGLLGGWLIAGWAGYRLRPLPAAWRLPYLIGAAVAVAMLVRLSYDMHRQLVDILVRALGPDPTGPGRNEVFPAYSVYVYNLVRSWNGWTGLMLGGAVLALVAVAHPPAALRKT